MAQDIDKILEELKNRKSRHGSAAKKEPGIKPLDKNELKEEKPKEEEKNVSEKTESDSEFLISEKDQLAISKFLNDEEVNSVTMDRSAEYDVTDTKKSEDYVDDKFREFFTQSVIVTKEPEKTNVDIKKKSRNPFRRKFVTDSLSLDTKKLEEERHLSRSVGRQSTGEIKAEAAENIARIMQAKTASKNEKSTDKSESQHFVSERPADKPTEIITVTSDTETKHVTIVRRPDSKANPDELVREILSKRRGTQTIEKSPESYVKESDESEEVKIYKEEPAKKVIKPVAPDENSIIASILSSVEQQQMDMAKRVASSDNNVADITGFISLDEEDEASRTDNAGDITDADEAVKTYTSDKKDSSRLTEKFRSVGLEDADIDFESEGTEVFGMTGEIPVWIDTESEDIQGELLDFRKTLNIRMGLGIICGITLTLLNILGVSGVGLPSVINPAENPSKFYIACTVIYAICFVGFIPTIISGLKASNKAPAADSFVSVACVLAMFQLICGIVFSRNAAIEDMTIFASFVCFALAFNAMGKKISTNTIIRNLTLSQVPDGINAGYVISDNDSVRRLARSLDEKVPQVLVSRKTGAISDFIESGFSVHSGEFTARKIVILTYVVTAVCFLLGFIRTRSIISAVICAAGASALMIPLSHTLVSSVPSALMQQSLQKVGALVNGWKGIDTLSKTTHVTFDAKHIFPEGTVTLRGIKAFEKERIDLALEYASAVLVKESEVLRPIFMSVLDGNTSLLREVTDCEYIECLGYIGWVNNSRVILGNRQLMEQYDISTPSISVEAKYIKNGCKPMYLAVGGKLFCMFIIQYTSDKLVKENLDKLISKGVNVILTSDDFNVDSALIESVYSIPGDCVNVLNQKETELLRGYTEYSPKSEACMAHIDSLPSLVAGFYRAESTQSSEKLCNTIQMMTVIIDAVMAVVFTYFTTLPNLSVLSFLLINFALMSITMLSAFAKRYQ